MPNTEQNPHLSATTVKCPSCERRKQRLHRWMRHIERAIEIVTLFVHLYIIGEAAGHAYISAFVAIA